MPGCGQAAALLAFAAAPCAAPGACSARLERAAARTLPATQPLAPMRLCPHLMYSGLSAR